MGTEKSSVRFYILLCAPGVLTIVFVILKLLKVISWGWLHVLSPYLYPLAMAVFALVVYIILMFLDFLVEKVKHGRKKYKK